MTAAVCCDCPKEKFAVIGAGAADTAGVAGAPNDDGCVLFVDGVELDAALKENEVAAGVAMLWAVDAAFDPNEKEGIDVAGVVDKVALEEDPKVKVG